ncbi:MAG TPA: peroxide stress protein YaaA, partial [Sorangium sp.]|nr:peroxide stress protein YaaA [Sorangium sp.]
QPYRLEMGTRLKTRRGANLYHYWGDTITKQINRCLRDHEDRTLVNLASGEYFKAVKPKALAGPVIECVFHDWKDKARTPNVISFVAKRARGTMARFIIDNRVDRAAGLKDFATERYRFQPKISTAKRLVFGRKFVPVGAAT